MKKYKYANAEQTSVNLIEDGATKVFGIHPGVHLWSQVEEYVEGGGVVESFETDEEKKDRSKKEAESALKAKKKEIRTEGLVVNGILFDTDLEARIAYLELMIKFMMDPDYTVQDWKASEGVWITMDKAIFDALASAWEMRLTDLFTFVKTKEAELAASEDPSEVSLEYTGA